jgi:hypothetical protein
MFLPKQWEQLGTVPDKLVPVVSLPREGGRGEAGA